MTFSPFAIDAAVIAASMQVPLFFNFAKPAMRIWAALIGATFVTLPSHGIGQDTVQRKLTARSKGQSAKATILSGIVDLPIVCSFLLVGILMPFLVSICFSTYDSGALRSK